MVRRTFDTPPPVPATSGPARSRGDNGADVFEWSGARTRQPNSLIPRRRRRRVAVRPRLGNSGRRVRSIVRRHGGQRTNSRAAADECRPGGLRACEYLHRMDALSIKRVVRLFETGRPASDDSPVTGAATRYRTFDDGQTSAWSSIPSATTDFSTHSLRTVRGGRASLPRPVRSTPRSLEPVALASLPAELSEAAGTDGRVAQR